MSPLLPGPATAAAQSENWTDDPSFDLGCTPISLGSSSSSSASFRSSPLRASSSKAQDIIEEDEDDWDLPVESNGLQLKSQHQPAKRSRDFSSVSTPTHSQQRISHRPRTSTSSLVEAGQVVGTGPKGVGVIKKLGSSSTAATPSNPFFFQKGAKERAVELDWESDLDFGDIDVRPRSRLTLSPPRAKGDVHDLDDLEAFLDDDDDRGQDTLKAGDTIKGLLPPPKHRNVATIKPSSIDSSLSKASAPARAEDDDLELESAFSIPLTLSHLSLASGSSPSSSPRDRDQRSRPRASQSSCSTWESPATSGHGQSFGLSSGRSGQSETSATSFSAGLTTELELDDVKILGAQPEEDEMDDDMEDGLVLPTPSFFSSGRVNELNSLLDRKRKQATVPSPQPVRHQEESFEDGLVFSGRSDLTQNRLIKSRKARTLPLPAGSGSTHARRSAAASGRATTGRERDRELERKRERDREREREQGWNRPKSPGPNSLLGLRSQSATNPPMPSPSQAYRRPESPVIGGSSRLNPSNLTQVDHTHSYGSLRSRGVFNGPPPTPSNASATGSMRLRHQKSHQRLTHPPQSPTLARKQSLASLQDAMSRPAPVVQQETDLHSSIRRKSNLGLMLPPAAPTPQTSRLTMPTASSLAKTRPSVGGVFPRSEARPVVARVMNAPKRARAYGDGTELEGIEDLSVDREREASRDKQASGAMRVGLGRPTSQRVPQDLGSLSRRKEPTVPEKRKKTPTTSTKRVLDATKTKSGRPRKPALLIKNLGGVDKRKVVGDMVWNPETLRWEGNENVLRDFDAPVAASARPALIAHFTGSSVGVPSPTVGATQTVRIVGDMRFDPERMCWVSNLAPEDDEPDPFEGMADDEDDENGGSTITRAQGRKVASAVAFSGAWSSRLASESSASTSMGSTFDGGEDEKLWEECKAAEERHRVEMRGWTTKTLGGAAEARDRERREEKRLWEIRNLAMRS